MKRKLQKILDAFFYLRKCLVTAVTYVSFRLYGLEVTWKQLYQGKYNSATHVDLNLDRAGDLSVLLSEVKESLKDSEARLATVTDKCKNLLTLSSLLLSLVTILIAKGSFDSLFMRVCFAVSGVAFFDTVILLLVFFDIGVGMSISIGQDEVELRTDDIKKCLMNLYLKCRTDLNNRINHLVDVYKVARFFFLFAFTVLVTLFILNLFLVTPRASAIAVARELHTDTNFLQSIRGDKGDAGPKGDLGPKGDKGEKGDSGERVILISNQNSVVTNTPILPVK